MQLTGTGWINKSSQKGSRKTNGLNRKAKKKQSSNQEKESVNEERKVEACTGLFFNPTFTSHM